MVEFKDTQLKCMDCEVNFVFTAGEQSFYLKKAFSEPKRCDDCRKKRKKDWRKRRRTLLRTLEEKNAEGEELEEKEKEQPKEKAMEKGAAK